ncbi:Transcriptional regulator GlxA family, contains an amidase domain and an AraC-type DNA-binding HTH domain [Monaibacterium marinum]|uniref:Transcriptional regulator GlxA family, contains an amidase domain and an AraC-type DNA-binding HTH domain n=1 Tax=Pontivivens marinum TaxID=1690039 RepID=A0A2C9CM73_9RHOB|nr:GlxA family transcriptional regulator [Monaibacterium marinum]SOH92338.1 Transcriptional regulator GlxA family, contains an amidase domain and an AraC-type DNA-binding HTH domain [Monaibacterium marinum]
MAYTQTTPQTFVFLLTENYSLLSYACAVEPLRLANWAMGEELYRWRLCAEGGQYAECSNGQRTLVDMGLEEIGRNDVLMICSGIDVKTATTKPLLQYLRREARRGIVIGGLCNATYIMARAGLLDNKRCTIHWDNRDSFVEEFPEIDLSQAIYTIDGNRYSSAGGSASADLMLKLISDQHGQELANRVADQMIYTTIRTDREEQRLSIPTRIGVRHPKLANVIRMMEDNIEEPVSPSILAAEVGMSTRQLERLFRRYLNRSPKRYYMELRLQKAKNLLMQTDMTVINVALACGFTSPSHFSKCYRAHFSTTPYRERGTQEGDSRTTTLN